MLTTGPYLLLLFISRPFERTITMQKDSNNQVGFAFGNGEIKQIVKDSSAARNGILTDHFLVEVNGQNVIGIKVWGWDRYLNGCSFVFHEPNVMCC